MLPVVPPEVHRQMFDILFGSPPCNPAPSQNIKWPQTPPQNYSSSPSISTVFTFEPKQSQPAPQCTTCCTCWNTSLLNQQPPQFQYSMCPSLPKNQLRYIGLDPRFHVDEPYKLRLTHDRISCTEDLEQTQNPRLPLAQVNIANKGAPLEYPPMPKHPRVTFVERTEAAGKCCGQRSCSCGTQEYGAQPNNNASQVERTTATQATGTERRNRSTLHCAHPVVQEKCCVTQPQTVAGAATLEPSTAPTQEPIARRSAIQQPVETPRRNSLTQEPIAAREPAIVQPADAPRPEPRNQEPIAAGEPAIVQPVNAPRPEPPIQEPIAAREPAVVQPVNAPRHEPPIQEPIAAGEPAVVQPVNAPRPEPPVQEPIVAREPAVVQPVNAPGPEPPVQEPIATGEPAVVQPVNAPRPEPPIQEPIAAGEPAVVQPVNAPRPEPPIQEPIAAREPAAAQPVNAPRPDAQTREPTTAAEPTATHVELPNVTHTSDISGIPTGFNFILFGAIVIIVAAFFYMMHIEDVDGERATDFS